MSDFSIKPVLTGDRAVLRPFTAGDVGTMAVILRDPEVLKLTGSAHTELGEEQVRAFYTTRDDQTDRLDLAITDRTTGELVGEAILFEYDAHNRSCTFRTLIGPAGRNRGLGTEACRLIVGYGFEQLGLHRISLDVFAFNPRARRAYEKAGFTAEGVEREALLHDGEWIDSVSMSILDREWAALSAAAR
ncbi:GNAT family N-acetyltransferase [Streptomyces beijiangensis]|uniref:GNAT family N-acetyltransferase n=1 Tax=Streptomyces beijiangensis TaxID=163361 RepID=A0A939JGY2_9ACTN|nr:GNAT family protein [Streptomyces beijiangensis]MBO0515671.1 GNAT family N-acetyltransferase [Streptomyces beijiangensis]